MVEIWDDVSAIPFMILLYFNEARLLVDWDAYALLLAVPLGAALTVVAITLQRILVHYTDSVLVRAATLFAPNYHLIKQQIVALGFRQGALEVVAPTTLARVLALIKVGYWVLWIICVLLLWAVANLRREYGLLYSKTRPKTLLAFKRLLIVFRPLQYLWHKIANDFVDIPREENTIDPSREIWILKVWDPSYFGLGMQVAFNPVNLAIITWVQCSVVAQLAIVTLNALFFGAIIHLFLGVIRDRQIIHSEMLQEYHQKVVKPLTSIAKQDVGIDASCGVARSSADSLNVYTFSKSRVWVTHDLSGHEVKEYVESSPPSIALQFRPIGESAIIHEMKQLRHENEHLRQELLQSRLGLRIPSRRSLYDPIDVRGSFFSGDEPEYEDDEDSVFTAALKRRKYPFRVPPSSTSKRASGITLSASNTPKLLRNSLPLTRSPSPTRPRGIFQSPNNRSPYSTGRSPHKFD